MNKTWLFLLLPLIFSCKKSRTSSVDETFSNTDLSDILQSDDYFRLKKKSRNSKGDSLDIRIVNLNDINNDGNSDSAIIEYNELNSKYKIRFSCFKDAITLNNISELQLKDMNDLNGDGYHEIMVFIQSEESCWDEIRLYSWVDKWIEKYSGLTYQCTEENTSNNYQFRKLDEHRVQLITYGVSRDSIDSELGDTLENIIPNAVNSHIITW